MANEPVTIKVEMTVNLNVTPSVEKLIGQIVFALAKLEVANKVEAEAEIQRIIKASKTTGQP